MCGGGGGEASGISTNLINQALGLVSCVLTACFMGSRPHGLSKSASEGAVSGVEIVCNC